MRKSNAPQRPPNGRGREVAALLAASHAVLEYRTFDDAARAVLQACKTILGAGAGLVAVRGSGGKGFEVAILDAGGLDLDSAAGLPAPLRRLSARAVRGGHAVFTNRLAKGTSPAPPGDRTAARSALLAPIVIDEEAAGLLGLIDKPGGFSAADGQLAEVFAEMAAVALLRSRTIDHLETSRTALESEVRETAAELSRAEGKFRALVASLPDVIARFDPDLRHLHVSSALQSMTGAPLTEYVGRTNRELGMPPELTEPWESALRRVFTSGRSERIELAVEAPEGTRHFDCRIAPEPDPGGAVLSVLSIARDVTDLRLAYQAEQRARSLADALREASVALTRSLDRETVLTTLLDRLRRIVPCDRASVMLREEESRLSVRAVFDGDRVVPLAPELRSELDAAEHPIVHLILTTGTAVLIPDIRERADWSLPADRSLEASWMGVPLLARGDVAGLFSLSKREPGYFNQQHVSLAEAMSSQASVAVENAVLFEQMQTSTVRMQSLARRLVEAQETERRHIARELHDEAGQALASLRFGLRVLEREIEAGGSVTGQVAELMQRTDAVIDGLHRLAADLRPASLDHLGLAAALRQYSRSAADQFGLTVRFKARGLTGERLPAAVETALYRVVQEAMTNLVRHARASRVDVLVERRDGRVLVMVEDDGVGFPMDRVQRGDHFGLLGLRERAEALGGSLTVESAPGKGTTVVVEVPSDHPHPHR